MEKDRAKDSDGNKQTNKNVMAFLRFGIKPCLNLELFLK